ncbi:hypothetical protein SAMN05443144_11063 [Fodinibius roseus]|uniref:Tc toxin complex TcA C-terminal TcB-binding domain-containing protein n=1 Tax=Fodinibius roseus TaxID=1194090 RepID=A0A1M5CR78_9BACT|nr:neuraminidase-like domain-containing protein [Fodinibius roseus]SHF57240.1 hypothetical protein SAMN05443144_11063 [Fodinibius roseus]
MSVFNLQEYLKDLLDFARLRVSFSSTDSPSDIDQVASRLADTFWQPFDRLIKEENRAIGERPVAHIRIAVEILRRYLEPLSVTTTNADKRYLLTAYQSLLTNLGTSYDELRMVHAAGDDELEQARNSLAERLGIDRVGRLDELFMKPDELTEEKLEHIFGLIATTHDPFDSPPAQPVLLKWRADYFRKCWKEKPAPVQSDGNSQIPLIDPDLIPERMIIDPDQRDAIDFADSDIVDTSTRKVAFDLWHARERKVAGMVEEVQAKIDEATGSQPDQLAAYDRVIEAFLGGVELETVLKSRTEGATSPQQDGESLLMLLTLTALRRLVRLRKLASSGALTELEWADAKAILVQFTKKQQFDTWLKEEKKKGLFLSPDFFILPEDLKSQALPSWRATRRARQRWEDALRARTEQMQAIVQSLQSAIDATEHVALFELREALIRALAEHSDQSDHTLLADKLTNRLMFDFKNSDERKTTRMEQAIEALRGLFFALRMERSVDEGLPDDNPVKEWNLATGSDDYSEADFDQDWHWMGTYKTRRAAEFVKDHPENFLRPGLRKDEAPQPPTASFSNLIKELRARSRLTAGQARQLANGDDNTFGYLSHLRTNGSDLPDELSKSFKITELLSEHDLVSRKELIKGFFDEREDEISREYTTDEGEVITIQDPHLAPNWLQEIFYFVPLAIALQLQQSGEYLAALDWYQTVYAYQFAPEERKIYHGLELESVFSDRPRITPDIWLREELNPHFFARRRKFAYTQFTIMSVAQCLLDYADSEFTTETAESIPRARTLYDTVLNILDLSEMSDSNTEIESLNKHAEVNLEKLRSGRNIAGMERTSESSDASEDAANLPVIGRGGQLVTRRRAISPPPTPYRYPVLVERAKELVNIAQQMETAFLSAQEKRDAEAYTLMQAGHDLHLSRARVKVQDLRVSKADTGVTLAKLQQDRAQIQSETFQEWIDTGLNEYEEAVIDNYEKAKDARQEAAQFQYAARVMSGFGNITNPASAIGWFGSTVAGGLATGAKTEAIRAETEAQKASIRASHERRKQEWQLQKNLAEKDIEIAGRQIKQAMQQKTIARQERFIAGQQAEYAEATVDFLANKFTNVELYEWMSGVLSRVYGYFLQQATGMAQLAASQIAFERQEPPPTYIRADYWQPPSETETSEDSDGEASDRRGLTGSARLLQDIYRLDQYAFETKERKLELSQTLSLVHLFPFEFQHFHETGVLPFATPMELFDRGFPGHYLRLIKQVSISVVALVPPTQGIRATLTASGNSRVVTDGGVFRTTTVRRDPELIAFTSPTEATGFFELAAEGEMMRPFEGRGVDTTWELEMPKAANAFDYSSIADVLLTIEYTALHSDDYRRQVIQQLDQSVSSERSFSFSDNFPDQWYDLHNPDQTDAPMAVQFDMRRQDFPPNFSGLEIQQVLLYFVRTGGSSFEVDVKHLHLIAGETTTKGGNARTTEGIISTRRGNGAGWMPLIGRSPIGTWELALPNTTEVRDYFKTEEIEDILFVISYKGQTPPWPE